MIGGKILLYKRAIVYSITLTLLILLELMVSAYTYSENIHKGLESGLIRLHVIANSDSAEDQEVKQKVRDEILKYMQSQSAGLESTGEARNLISNNLEKIEQIADDVLQNSGFDYKAKAYFGKYSFPTKVYGDVTLPAGEYQSLRIVLGNGSGANWWCVMFPPLCFVDASKGIVPESSKAQMQNILTEEQYNIAMSNSSGSNYEVKVKFKIVELFQQTKIKLASTKRQ